VSIKHDGTFKHGCFHLDPRLGPLPTRNGTRWIYRQLSDIRHRNGVAQIGAASFFGFTAQKIVAPHPNFLKNKNWG
jgi:hypothetical protein